MVYERQGPPVRRRYRVVSMSRRHHALTSRAFALPPYLAVNRGFCTTSRSRTVTMEVLADLKTHDLEELRPIKELKCFSYGIWNLESYYFGTDICPVACP